jgi:hypothetical protein
MKCALWKKKNEQGEVTHISGTLEVDFGDSVTLKHGEKYGITIRPNKDKKNENSPDYYADFYNYNEKEIKF